MKIHEYQAKSVLARFGVPVPRGEVAFSAAEAAEIARRLGATRYVNAPGGRRLYEPERFAAAGIELRFLDSYPGPSSSILHRILEEDRQSLSDDILAASVTSR